MSPHGDLRSPKVPSSWEAPVVVVGAGLAGASAAKALRAHGFDGEVVLVGDEPEQPYERPPLSKAYLMGRSPREEVFVNPPSWYAEHGVDLRLGTAVTAIDRAGRRVHLADGETLPFARLLLATGSAPRRLPVAGTDLDGVLTLRRLPDSDRLRDALADGGPLAVIGGGWIGLEVAAAARDAGVQVTVIEATDLPLQRVLGPEVARVFAGLHRSHGVDLRLGATVTAITGRRGAVTGVRLGDGTLVPASAVLVAVGAAPSVALAATAGLAVGDGVLVDEHLRTSDPDVYAVGDIANAYHPKLGIRVRVEHWANALNQPPVAVADLLGEPAVYDRPPYFYTDQYELGMEYMGHAPPGRYDRLVVRGDLEDLEFIAFWLHHGRVSAAMNVNTWADTDALHSLVAAGAAVDPARLADPVTDLAELAATATPPRHHVPDRKDAP